eukprot:3749-Heterococcus_DN1.PRE.2
MWYSIGIVGRDSFGAVPFCGTNAVLRSDALLELGGLKYGALTEDLHSSLVLAAKFGWRGRYMAEPLAVGLAPPNLYEILAGVLAYHSVLLCATLSTITTAFVHRLRWARGSYDMLSLNLGTLIRSKHLSFRQKASWFTWSNSRALDMYSWIPLCIHFVLARYTALYSPGAGHCTSIYTLDSSNTY